MEEDWQIRESILAGLEESRKTFHALLETMNEEDFQRQSLNPGWTNGEIMAHITFGFIILNSLLPLARLLARLPGPFSLALAAVLNAVTGPFNWVNKLGARGQGKVFTRKRVGSLFDRTVDRLIKMVKRVGDTEWQRGMYYPVKWDPNFERFMTVEKLLQYPVRHFNFHIQQLSS